ncbi:MAG: hypothetical protein K2F97_07305, partial [Muribaculaceae bacterium]|nr:hypothetical protein [Muribaculaceae bacterium]
MAIGGCGRDAAHGMWGEGVGDVDVAAPLHRSDCDAAWCMWGEGVGDVDVAAPLHRSDCDAAWC